MRNVIPDGTTVIPTQEVVRRYEVAKLEAEDPDKELPESEIETSDENEISSVAKNQSKTSNSDGNIPEEGDKIHELSF